VQAGVVRVLVKDMDVIQGWRLMNLPGGNVEGNGLVESDLSRPITIVFNNKAEPWQQDTKTVRGDK
jgi:hypothetical protein